MKAQMRSNYRILQCVAITLAVLAWSSPASCGEIHDAARNGDLEKVRALIKDNPNLVSSKDDKGGDTPLHWASNKGQKDIAELLLANKADVNAKDNKGQTPLSWAAMGAQKDMVKLLLASGADVNAKADNGGTPLLAAGGNGDIVELLLAKGADVNAKYSKTGDTALHSVSCCYKNVVEMLLAKGADVNAKNNRGETPLHVAANLNGYKEVVQALLAAKGDVNAKDNDGWTPLHRAAQHDYKDVASLLLDYKADVNATNNNGVTPLHEALFYDCDDVADVLRLHGGQDSQTTPDASTDQSGGATFTGNIPVAKKDTEGFYHVSDTIPDFNAYRDDDAKATIRNSFASKVSGSLSATRSITITEIQKSISALSFHADSIPIAFNRTPDDVFYSGIIIGKTANVVYEKPMSERWFMTSDSGKIYCRGQITGTYQDKKLAVLLYGESAMQAVMNIQAETNNLLTSSTQPAATRATLTVVSWDPDKGTAVIRLSGGQQKSVSLVKVSAAPSPAAVAVLVAPPGPNDTATSGHPTTK